MSSQNRRFLTPPPTLSSFSLVKSKNFDPPQPRRHSLWTAPYYGNMGCQVSKGKFGIFWPKVTKSKHRTSKVTFLRQKMYESFWFSFSNTNLEEHFCFHHSLTAISHVRIFYFSQFLFGLLFSFYSWTFISLFYFDFDFLFLFGLLYNKSLYFLLLPFTILFPFRDKMHDSTKLHHKITNYQLLQIDSIQSNYMAMMQNDVILSNYITMTQNEHYNASICTISSNYITQNDAILSNLSLFYLEFYFPYLLGPLFLFFKLEFYIHFPLDFSISFLFGL